MPGGLSFPDGSATNQAGQATLSSPNAPPPPQGAPHSCACPHPQTDPSFPVGGSLKGRWGGGGCRPSRGVGARRNERESWAEGRPLTAGARGDPAQGGSAEATVRSRRHSLRAVCSQMLRAVLRRPGPLGPGITAAPSTGRLWPQVTATPMGAAATVGFCHKTLEGCFGH